MKLFLLSVLIVPALLCNAQKPASLPEFGKVDKATLEMKECSFEKNAEAMVVFDEAESYLNLNLNSPTIPIFEQTSYHTRIKIFGKKGFDHANIKIKYRNDPDISIKKLHAQTYNIDAAGNVVVTKVEKSAIYDKQINKRYSEKIFVFPDVKEGSVLEYEYVLEGASAGVWYFQKNIPVAFSRFIVDFSPEISVAVTPYSSLPVNKSNNSNATNNYSWYTMENVPAFIDEPYMSAPKDYLQRLDLDITGLSLPGMPYKSFIKTWPKIVRTLVEDEDFGRQLKKEIPRTSDLDKMLQNITDDFQKMKIIHKYVRSNMKWNNLDNIWALDGVKSAWKDKIGTSGEINLILINLLKDAGIKVRPILVSTRENGIIITSVAGYDQFDKVMAYVDIADKHYVLDATEQETPSHLIPLNVQASEGLLISKLDNFEWGWTVLWNDKNKFAKAVFINADLDSKGKMSGIAKVTSYDYEKMKDLKDYRKGTDKLKELKITQAGLTVDSLTVEGADVDSLPLVQEFKFTAPTNSSGDYNYFSLNYFTGFEKNPFLSEERRTEIFYGALQDYSISALVYLPEGYVMDELPPNMKMITSDSSIIFKRYVSQGDGFLNVQVTLKFKNPIYSVEAYPEINEFFKKMYALLDEKFVYKKK